MRSPNALTKLFGIRYPIIQGPFGGGFSTAKLTATVSNAGGLGSFGANNLNPAAIGEKIAEIKKLTDRPFGVNLWVQETDVPAAGIPKENYAEVAQSFAPYFSAVGAEPPAYPATFGEKFSEQVEALVEARPKVFSFVFGLPQESVLERCRARGIVTVAAATTLAEARAAEAAGVDALVVTGLEAGGHRPAFLLPAEESLVGLSALLPVVAAQVKLPLIAAGGLVTADQIRAAATLGAQGFQLGTAFLACEESGANDVHREAIFSSAAERTRLSRYYTGRLARFIDNEYLSRAESAGLPRLPYPAHNALLAPFKAAALAQGKLGLAPLYAGQGAPLVRYRRAHELVDSLVKELSLNPNQEI